MQCRTLLSVNSIDYTLATDESIASSMLDTAATAIKSLASATASRASEARPTSLIQARGGRQAESSFNLSGPLALTRFAHEELTRAGRFKAVTLPSMLQCGAEKLAWVRQSEFGLHAPFGAFAVSQGEGKPSAYFTLVPSNVPHTSVSVDLGEHAPAHSAPALKLTYPLRSRVEEVKRAIEVQTKVLILDQSLSLPASGAELHDEKPLEDYVVEGRGELSLVLKQKVAHRPSLERASRNVHRDIVHSVQVTSIDEDL